MHLCKRTTVIGWGGSYVIQVSYSESECKGATIVRTKAALALEIY